jgi:rRNA processing
VLQQRGERDARGGGRGDAAPGVAASRQGRGKFNALELLAKRREEAQAAELQAEAEAAAAAAERDAAREAAVARRRAQSVAMRKKNARGQPVMKHRLEAILDKLQRAKRP